MYGVTGPMLAIRYGDMTAKDYGMQKARETWDRAIVEPNQVPELLPKFGSSCYPWQYLLGKGRDMASILSLVGMDWNTAEATCDEATADAATNVWFAPRLI